MKDAFRVLRVEDFAVISSGSTPLRSRHKDFYENGTIPWVKTLDLTNGRIHQTDECITPLAARSCKPFKAGTVLIAMYGGYNQIGRTGLLSVDAAVNQAISALTVDETVASPEYLIQYLNHNVDKWKKFAASSRKDPNITSNDVRDFEVVLPSVLEQNAIADTLSTWDTASVTLERLIAVKKKIQASVRERAFHKTANSALVRIGDVTKESEARNYGRLDRGKVMAVTKSVGMRPMREETIATSLDRYKAVPPLGFAYNPMRLNIGSIAMSSFESDVLVSPDYVVFECVKSRMLPGLIDHLRQTHRWANHFETAGSGGVRVRIHYEELAKFEFWLPDLRAQASLLAGLDLLAEEIRLLHKQLELLQRQKRGLMQKLLAGTWRVRIPKETT